MRLSVMELTAEGFPSMVVGRRKDLGTVTSATPLRAGWKSAATLVCNMFIVIRDLTFLVPQQQFSFFPHFRTPFLDLSASLSVVCCLSVFLLFVRGRIGRKCSFLRPRIGTRKRLSSRFETRSSGFYCKSNYCNAIIAAMV